MWTLCWAPHHTLTAGGEHCLCQKTFWRNGERRHAVPADIVTMGAHLLGLFGMRVCKDFFSTLFIVAPQASLYTEELQNFLLSVEHSRVYSRFLAENQRCDLTTLLSTDTRIDVGGANNTNKKSLGLYSI